VTTSAEHVRFTLAATNGFDPGGTIRRSVNVRFTGVDRKLPWSGRTDANDPTQTYLVSCLTE